MNTIERIHERADNPKLRLHAAYISHPNDLFVLDVTLREEAGGQAVTLYVLAADEAGAVKILRNEFSQAIEAVHAVDIEKRCTLH